MRSLRIHILAALLIGWGVPGFSQMGFELKLEKPKEYEERILRGEKTTDKRIKFPQRILQNTVTRYNYFFNASNKLNEVLNRAKQAFQDDFTKLLPFYNYTLEKTAQDGVQLDSIIWKSNSGIVLHDLRNDWNDDLYLLWGAAYYFQQKFDSARILFQFINQAYAPREKDGYARTIGSARDGNNALSISTPEKKGFARKMLSNGPPRRNDAFLWQIRNFIAQNQLAEAASLIEALRRDADFPSRLQEELHEVQAWWYYQQQNWDSTARHLSLALDRATTQNERARWEFLLGQLYERTGQWNEAEKYYSRSIPRTTDPILEIYARLASIRTNKDNETDAIASNIRDLQQMAKRDKYTEYRDIIYYMAAQIQWQTGDLPATKSLLLSSVQVPTNNASQRNQAFEQLARISLQQKEYRQAYNFYDSIKLDDPKLTNADSIRQQKEVLGIIATQQEIIERQDSLLRIVAMPEEERKEFIRKLVKEIRKKQGLKDEPIRGGNGLQPPGGVLGGGNEPRGEWYFYNANSRSRGLAEFQARWGNRPNADNWRRLSALINARQQPAGGGAIQGGSGNDSRSGEVDFETLYAGLPTTPEQLKKVNDSLQQAWFVLGKTYIQRMEDCANGIQALEKVAVDYPDFQPMDEALFLLYFCHQRNGDTQKANALRNRLEKQFSNSEKTKLVLTGKDPVREQQAQATSLYQTIYDQFVSGKYAEALALKKKADSSYGRNYWTPQLMYVEAVYYTQQRSDSIAINRLSYITQNYQQTPLAKKAEILIGVLNRRDSIEKELNAYTIKPTQPVNPDTLQVKSKEPKPVVAPAPQKPVDTTKVKTPLPPAPPKPNPAPDTVSNKPKAPAYTFNPQTPQQVVVILQDVDAVFANEAKNALFRHNRSTYYNKTYTLELVGLNDKQRLLLITPFQQATEASTYLKEIRKAAPTDIFPWLSAGRYRFGMIDAANLDKVRADKNYDAYESFLRNAYPELFQ